jgi:phosphatidyl-myo-inositol dimannoside synthase
MSVLLVTQDFPPDCGGIQTYCWELAQHLHAAGHTVRVLCPTPERRARGVRLASLPPGLTVDRVGVHGSLLFAPLALGMRRYLRAHPAVRTIVYAQWQSALWQLAAPGLARRYRRLCLVHGRELLKTVWGPLGRPLARRVLGSMDQVHPVSGRVRELVDDLELPPQVKVWTIPPGVDPTRFRPLPVEALRRRLGLQGARVVLSLSRLAARKNLEGLLAAFARVRAQARDSLLVIGGDGPERARLEAQVRAGRLSGSVRFLGRIPDEELPAHYNLAELFVLPSRDHRRDIEGFGITLLEAGACERPVVAGQAGGMADAVVHGETGLLVDPTSERALADAMLRLLAEPPWARRLGEAARTRIVGQLSWAHCVQRLQAGFAGAPGGPRLASVPAATPAPPAAPRISSAAP